MAGEHFARTTGYERNAELAAGPRAAGLEKASAACPAPSLWGTPGQITERIAHRRGAPPWRS